MIGPISARNIFCSLVALLTLSVASLLSQAQTYTVLHRFAGGPADGADPVGSLVQDPAGNLYGVTSSGGSSGTAETGFGTIYKLDTSGVLTVLYSFTGGADGGTPGTGLFRDTDGSLYGINGGGGDPTCRCGTIFKLDPSNVLTTLHKFHGHIDGRSGSIGRLIPINGELYGTTANGGDTTCPSGCGTIFKITKGGEFTELYQFTGGADSNYPSSLIRDADGNLYGSTTGSESSTSGHGTIFELDTAGNFSTLYTFAGGADGFGPVGHLLRDVNGNFHGVTPFGGTSNCYSFPTGCGVVFHLNPSGVETVIHSFSGDAQGHTPGAGLLDISGVLYGTTQAGGSASDSCKESCGLIFQISQSGQYSVAYRFTGGRDGWGPFDNNELLLGSDGSIYGTTFRGGLGTCTTGGCGVIFKFTP